MLTPDYLDNCANEILKLYAQLDESITRDIARRIIKTGGMTLSGGWQSLKVQESGLIYDDIIKRISEITGKSNAELKKLFEDAGIESVTYDSKIYEAAGLKPLPLNLSPSAVERLSAGLKKTGGLINNLTKTTALEAQKAYINACSLAELQTTSGAFDYVTAIRNAVNNAISEGAVVSYPSGHTDKLDVAIRRSVITGVGQTTGEVSLGYAKDMGCDLMEITAHSGARPSHAQWQGKIVSLSGRKGYLSLEDIGYGTGAGFKGWNCRHDWYPFFEGISKPAYSKERLEELENKSVEYEGKKYTEYEAQQLQRSMERKIRDTRRVLAGYDEALNAADDDQLKAMLKSDFDRKSVLLKKQEAAYKDFCSKTARYQDKARLQVKGFDRSVSQKAVQANKKAPENIANSHNNDIIEPEEKLRIPQIKSSSVSQKIDTGEYSTALSKQQYAKHVQGTPQFESYKKSRIAKGGNPQSILTISEEDARDIIIQKAGTGIVRADRKGRPKPMESITCDKIIGKYYGGGLYHKTNKATIHYGKKFSHIVPIKGDDYD